MVSAFGMADCPQHFGYGEQGVGNLFQLMSHHVQFENQLVGEKSGGAFIAFKA